MFTIKMETDNDAFQDDLHHEIKNCLHEVSEHILYGINEGSILDSNGNKVGTFKLTNR